jgi:TonB-dependent SusC/RagA subfamily outer membrane receptor
MTVSVIKEAANAIAQVQVGTYIFISVSVVKPAFIPRQSLLLRPARSIKQKKTIAGMRNAGILFTVLLALRHCHMASLTPRVILSCAIFVGLTSGCASSNVPPPPEKPAPSGSPSLPLAGTVVTGEELDRAGDDPIEKTLAARVPGVLITRTPDGGLAIRIRGNNSISANMEPLYVIDGVEVTPGPGGALLGINPHDIASIEVLKDAASLSFYGLRAGNGVILIKTKRQN